MNTHYLMIPFLLAPLQVFVVRSRVEEDALKQKI